MLLRISVQTRCSAQTTLLQVMSVQSFWAAPSASCFLQHVSQRAHAHLDPHVDLRQRPWQGSRHTSPPIILAPRRHPWQGPSQTSTPIQLVISMHVIVHAAVRPRATAYHDARCISPPMGRPSSNLPCPPPSSRSIRVAGWHCPRPPSPSIPRYSTHGAARPWKPASSSSTLTESTGYFKQVSF